MSILSFVPFGNSQSKETEEATMAFLLKVTPENDKHLNLTKTGQRK